MTGIHASPEETLLPVVVYGTRNPAKAIYMKETLRGIPLLLTDLCDSSDGVTDAEENGQTPMENAEHKAVHYWKQLRRPVFSIDSAMCFRGVSPEDQPGVHVRRRNGHRMDDEEMIAYYAALANKYGGRLEAYYHNALCLVLDDAHVLRHDEDALNTMPFLLVDQPHARRQNGFPIDSLSVDIRTGAYFYDLPATQGQGATEDEPLADLALISGFAELFKRLLPLLRQHCPLVASPFSP